MNTKGGYVYILASGRNGTLYIGVTANLATRHWQHTSGNGSEFVRKYKAYKLVYYEQFNDIREAILREKRMKKWERKWKLWKIEEMNSGWKDLSLTLG